MASTDWFREERRGRSCILVPDSCIRSVLDMPNTLMLSLNALVVAYKTH